MESPRILVVEDEVIVAKEIEEQLIAAGYGVVGRVTTGERALEVAETQRPNLVLMDIRLKGAMDGIDTAIELRRRLSIPVIFLTAYSEDLTLERAKQAEPFGYILKPFHDRELKSAIEIGLYKHGTEMEILRLNRLYEVLSQVNQNIVHLRGREELLSSICQLIVDKGKMDLAWIGWVDPTTSRIIPEVSHAHKVEIDPGPGMQFCVAGSQGGRNTVPELAVLKDVPVIGEGCTGANCPLPSNAAEGFSGFHSCGSFPLRFQGTVQGVLNVCMTERGFFREKEMALLKEVASDLSFALDKIEADFRREQAEAALRVAHEQLENALAGAEAASTAKSCFLSNMSHEFLTPLNNIIGGVYLLLNTPPLSTEQEEYTQIVLDSARELHLMVMDILNHTMMQDGSFTLETRVFELSDVLRKAGNTLEWMFGKHIRFVYGVDPGIPARLLGDREHLQQIFTQLLGNTVRSTQSRAISVQARLEAADESSMLVRFEITGTGTGIPGDRLEHLFTPPFHVDSFTTLKCSNSSLGMAVSKLIAEAMGGEIGVEGQEGTGSKSWFTARFHRVSSGSNAVE